MGSLVQIRKTTRHALPRVQFERIARAVLGRSYELSLVLCGDGLAVRINKRHRHKSYRANVLTFPLTKTEGEIFLNVHAALREAKRYRVSLGKRLTLLYVHACLHLKGIRHGTRMERETKRLVKRFG